MLFNCAESGALRGRRAVLAVSCPWWLGTWFLLSGARARHERHVCGWHSANAASEVWFAYALTDSPALAHGLGGLAAWRACKDGPLTGNSSRPWT